MINQLDITEIYRLSHPITTEYTFFSNSYLSLIKTHHILVQKTHLNKFNRNHIMYAFRPQWIKQESNYRKQLENPKIHED